MKDLNEMKKNLEDVQKLLEVKQTVPQDPPSTGNETQTLTKGQKVTVDGMEYEVLDPAAKTVELKSGNKKKSGKLTINTVNINGENCTVVSIGANAFKKANKLTSVTIGSGVTSIGKNAFANAAKLQSVVIGKKVKTIAAGAFSGCKKLSKVTFKGTAVTKIGKKAFKNTSKKMTVTVPKKLKKNKKFKSKLTSAGMNKKMKYK